MKKNKIVSKFGFSIITVTAGAYSLWQLLVCMSLAYMSNYGKTISMLSFLDSFFMLLVGTYFFILGIKGLRK